MEVSVKEIVEILMKRFWWITVFTFTGLVLFYTISKYVMKPSYTATVQMYVDQNDSTVSADLSELTYAQKVVTTYITFLETKIFYKEVLEECKLGYSWNELKTMTNIQSVNSTEVFEINVTSLNPEDSYLIVKAMQKIAPKMIHSYQNSAVISVVDPVDLPEAPTSPNIFKNTLIGGLLGLFLSVMIFILWEFFDVKLKNREDLEKYEMPILGEIPNFYKNIKQIKKQGKRKNQKELKAEMAMELNDHMNFCIHEAYKSFRTNLRFTLQGEECKKILISSPLPEDGKSTVSFNISISISKTGAKVLLIDCDLRRGKLHRLFQLMSKPGLSDVLSDMVELNDVIMNTAYDNLNVITMGTNPPNPMDLLEKNKMEEVMERLEKEYDYIILDSPPVNVVSDPLSLTKLVDGVVLVVRENFETHPNIESAIEKFKFAKANILGFVINDISFSTNKKSGYNYSYCLNKDNQDQ